MTRKYRQGRFVPVNPSKYSGDFQNIVYRSSWERKLMIKLDMSPQVLSWVSEERPITYYDSIKQKQRRYFIDFYVIWKSPNNGKIRNLAIEVKPFAQTQPPKEPKRKTKKSEQRMLDERITYQCNVDKWKAARDWCARNNFEFIIFTENEINRL